MIIYLCIALLVSGVFSAEDNQTCCVEDITVSGRLTLIGNEPFVHTALITDEDERYVLNAEPKVIEEMWRARAPVTVTGKCKDDRRYGVAGPYIEVRSWEPVE